MKDLQNEKRPYEAPQLTTVDFKTEKGYATSGLTATRGGYSGGSDNANDQEGNNQTWF